MSIYFTADNHFQHANILKFGRGNGQFNSINHHDLIIQARWYETVAENDDIYVLGDVAMGDISISLKKFEHLPGNKFLVPGNHDRIFSGNSKSHIQRYWSLYEEVGFTILPETYPMSIPTASGVREVILSHFPYKATSLEAAEKYSKNRPEFTGKPLIHGHTHSENRFNLEHKFEFHVGVDANDFTPVHIAEISSWLETFSEKQ